MKESVVNGISVLLVNLNGEFYAIGNACTHLQCMLSRGTLREDHVICPCHGATFNVKTGRHVSGPGSDARKYELKIEGDQILIDL